MARQSLKPLPTLKSDDEAHDWLQSSDLTEYDLSGGVPFKEWLASFETMHKDARVNLRLPQPLIEGYKAEAARKGIPYQRLMRNALTKGLSQARAKGGRGAAGEPTAGPKSPRKRLSKP